MSILISFAALFVSIFLVQVGSGSLGPLDALSGATLGFSNEEIGLLGSAHFLGFFAGCYLTPRYIGTVGHSRAFAAAAAVGATGALLHPVFEGPIAWAILRTLTGLAIAAAYTVIESWLQAKMENHNRGRIYGTFRVVDLVGQIAAQGLIAVLEPGTYAAYNIVAVFCCICLLPLTLSRRAAPKTPEAPRLRPMVALRLSPTACAGIVVAGLSGSALRMVGPIFAVENGLDQTDIALFLAAAVIGGAIGQVPIGWIADKLDRRLVLVGLSVAAMGACAAMAMMAGPGARGMLFLGSFLFGLTTFPLYSVSAAYANDFATEDFVVELNAALILFFSIGAIVSPVISASLISSYGPGALFLFIALAHLALVVFALYRMTRRRAAWPRTPYRYLPRTSMVLGRTSATDTPSDPPLERREP
ncbi:MAG: MFS transporter [Pseudomonadota bacterium]